MIHSVKIERDFFADLREDQWSKSGICETTEKIPVTSQRNKIDNLISLQTSKHTQIRNLSHFL